MKSLRARLLVLWGLSLAVLAALGVLLVQVYAQSTAAQTDRAEATLTRACERIRDRYVFYTAGSAAPIAQTPDPTTRANLTAAVTLALANDPGVEGGIWTAAGPVAYAYPTYAGTGPKTDLPEAERDRIAQANAEAAGTLLPVLHRTVSGTQTLLLAACPLESAAPVTAWTMTRIQAAPGYERLRLGLGLLLALVVLMSTWLAWVVTGWSRQIGGLETALSRNDIAALPTLARTGERDLDRLVAALNDLAARLAAARGQADAMTARAAAAERLAALGRVAAGVAHEMRNPLAAMRLKAENATAGDDQRRTAALGVILGQIGRLDRLTTELLAMTQRRDPAPRRTELAALLHACADDHRDLARNIQIIVECPELQTFLDPDLLTRALANLVANALQHAPPASTITLRAEPTATGLRITVTDTGPGIPPDITETLFEPFVTARPEGTGLGLAIAREMVEAMGGTLTLTHASAPTIFAIDLPGEAAWPAS
jgi:signal transduction histidine kinase